MTDGIKEIADLMEYFLSGGIRTKSANTLKNVGRRLLIKESDFMLIVLFIISLSIMVGSIVFLIKDDFDHDMLCGVSIMISLLTGVAIFIIIAITIELSIQVSSSFVIDKKISMYQEENKKIEKEITSVVNSYKDYEKEVIINAGEMATILIRFPELKSNELVNKQIQVYVDNNNKIKKLKEDKIDYSIAKWWLYFGK